MNRTIIHVDMDAFFAAVEIRDNPELKGQPLVIGALPHERGVVSTCSYEARPFGVRSGMSIKTAYQLCPHAIYLHPDMRKYQEASHAIHRIWSDYTDLVEYVSLDEGYLDVTGSAHLFGGARQIGHEIKARTLADTGLTCSVGIGYSMASAKLASEEKKPDGFFEIPSADALLRLILDRNVRVVYGVGGKTAEKLETAGIRTVRDIHENEERVVRLFGKHGQQIVELARGIDTRRVTSLGEREAKSIGKECTFQQDTTDISYMKDVLRVLARELALKLGMEELYCRTVTLKVTYGNMKSITRSQSGKAIRQASELFHAAAGMLDAIDKQPIRLVGISMSGLTKERVEQLSLVDLAELSEGKAEGKNVQKRDELADQLLAIQRKYGADIIKTGGEIIAEKRLRDTEDY